MLSTPAANPAHRVNGRRFAARIPVDTDVAPLRSTRRRSRTNELGFSIVPVLLCVAGFALGELLGHWVWQPPLVVVLAIVLSMLLTWVALRCSLRLALLPLGAVWISLGMLCVQLEPQPSQQRELLAYADGLNRQIIGRVVRTNPLPASLMDQDRSQGPTSMDEGRTSIDIEVQSIEDAQPDVSRMVPVSGGVRLTVAAGSPAAMPVFHCGELVQVGVQLRQPERYYDVGAWDYTGYLLQQGIAAHAYTSAAKVSQLGGPQHASAACLLHAAQAWAAGRLTQYTASRANHALPALLRLSTLDAGMLNAMLFGDRTHLDHGLRLGFERTGSFHLFVVSGLHLAVLAGCIFVVARKLRMPQLPATLTTLLLVTGYALLTGFGVPVQRALWMTAVLLMSRLLTRDRNPLNALGVAALAVLVLAPHALFEASFQMTFLAILAIGGIAVPLGERTFVPYKRASHLIEETDLDVTLPPRVAEFRVLLRLIGERTEVLLGRRSRAVPALMLRWSMWLAELALVSVVAECLMVLPMAVYFHRVTVMAVPANLLSIPFIGLLVPLMVATFTASLVHPWLGLLPGACTAFLLHVITGIVGTLSHMRSADLRMPPPAVPMMVAVVLLWAFAVWAIRKRRWLAVVGVGILPVAAVLVLWPQHAAVKQGVLEVTALDVGQGDSLLVVSPQGQTLLVDAGGPIGGPFAANSHYDIGEEVVSPYLWSRHIGRLDAVALTHAHSDHMGGMAAVLRNFRPRELWVGDSPPVRDYAALLAEARSLGVVVRQLHAGESFGFGGAQVNVMAPQLDYVTGAAPANNDSLVMDVVYGSSNALLEGDAEAPSERTMLNAGLVHHATLLKVGHHGSRTSSTPMFLAAASPQDAVISAGRHNPFGHPKPEVIQEFADAHVRLYRTDMMGASSFFLRRDGSLTTRTFSEH